jgi:hypothetical protein
MRMLKALERSSHAKASGVGDPRVRRELVGLVLVEAMVAAACIEKLEHATADAGSQVP